MAARIESQVEVTTLRRQIEMLLANGIPARRRAIVPRGPESAEFFERSAIAIAFGRVGTMLASFVLRLEFDCQIEYLFLTRSLSRRLKRDPSAH